MPDELARFQIDERRLLRDYPIDSGERISQFAEIVRELMIKHGAPEPLSLSPEQQQAAFRIGQLPERVAADARALGVKLSPELWTRLDGDQRYALLKLGGGQRVKRNFAPAPREFLHPQPIGNEQPSTLRQPALRSENSNCH